MVDPYRETIIKAVYDYLMEGNVDSKLILGRTIDNLSIQKNSIKFTVNEQPYTLTLSKNRK